MPNITEKNKCGRCGLSDKYVLDLGLGEGGYHRELKHCIEFLKEELRRLQRFERMWIRVKQIRAEGCLLTSEDLEEIERQELK